MVEVINILGYTGEGKTTRLVEQYLNDECILITNENTLEGIASIVERLLGIDFLDFPNISLVACSYQDSMLEVLEESGLLTSNRGKLLLLDGIGCEKHYKQIIKALPKRFSTIVYTTQMARSNAS